MDITSRKNDKVLHMKKLGASGGYRRERGEFLCDGEKLLREAVKCGADIHDVLVCGELPVALPDTARVYSVTREVIEAVSPLKTPQDVVFSAAVPRWDTECVLSGAVILENIQDPGNVGTVLRTANAFGIKTVVLTGDCADIYGPKAVRASMGAVFRQRVEELGFSEIRALAERTCIYGAALSAGAVDLRSTDISDCAVAIGNEGSGLSEEILSICKGRVIIPMRPECESLNAAAAAAIIMWEMSKASI